jgi:hypothetical protein
MSMPIGQLHEAAVALEERSVELEAIAGISKSCEK